MSGIPIFRKVRLVAKNSKMTMITLTRVIMPPVLWLFLFCKATMVKNTNTKVKLR